MTYSNKSNNLLVVHLFHVMKAYYEISYHKISYIIMIMIQSDKENILLFLFCRLEIIFIQLILKDMGYYMVLFPIEKTSIE